MALQHQEGKCPACGEARLVLAVDSTAYRAVTYNAVDGTLQATSPLEVFAGDVEDSVRLYCAACWTELDVPANLDPFA